MRDVKVDTGNLKRIAFFKNRKFLKIIQNSYIIQIKKVKIIGIIILKTISICPVNNFNYFLKQFRLLLNIIQKILKREETE